MRLWPSRATATTVGPSWVGMRALAAERGHAGHNWTGTHGPVAVEPVALWCWDCDAPLGTLAP